MSLHAFPPHILVQLTQEIPNEDIFEETGRFKSMLESLFQSRDKATLSTKQQRQTASLVRKQESGRLASSCPPTTASPNPQPRAERAAKDRQGPCLFP